jgi:nitrite reductase (NO-forming)
MASKSKTTSKSSRSKSTDTSVKTKPTAPTTGRPAWVDVAAGAVRTAFGLIWAVDTYFKFQPGFLTGYLDIIKGAASGQPAWLAPWFNFWVNTISINPDFFAWSTRIIEAVLALGLLFGLGRKWIYVLGAAFTFIIWSVPQGLGGPYAPGKVDIDSGLIYMLVFVSLIVIDSALGRSPYSVDYYIERRFPKWRLVAELAPPAVLAQEPARLPWATQIPIIIAVLIFLLLILAILTDTLNLAAPGTGSIPQLVQVAFLHSS